MLPLSVRFIIKTTEANRYMILLGLMHFEKVNEALI